MVVEQLRDESTHLAMRSSSVTTAFKQGYNGVQTGLKRVEIAGGVKVAEGCEGYIPTVFSL